TPSRSFGNWRLGSTPWPTASHPIPERKSAAMPNSYTSSQQGDRANAQDRKPPYRPDERRWDGSSTSTRGAHAAPDHGQGPKAREPTGQLPVRPDQPARRTDARGSTQGSGLAQ